MRLLLDTCIVYDWLRDRLRDEQVKALIQSEDSHVSPITVWEMAIKRRIGKMALPTTDIETAITDAGFAWLPVQPSHAQAVVALPALHRDPFDLLLIAQAKREGMRLISYDSLFQRYLPDAITPNK